MAQKQRLILGAWGAAGTLGAVSVFRSVRDFERRVPCIREAARSVAASDAGRRALGPGELRLARWPRHCVVEPASGLARASFELRGQSGFARVVFEARRSVKAQEAWEDSQDDDELELQLSGWRYYWAKPWELKIRLFGALRSWRQPSEPKAWNEEDWQLDVLFFLPNGDVSSPTVLLGDARALPEYEAMCVRCDADSKGEASRRRLRWVLGAVAAGTAVAGAFRFVKSLRLQRSYGFAKSSLLRHRDVASVLGSSPTVQGHSGTFGSNYINGQLRLTNPMGAIAEVELAALREGSAQTWRVVMARMKHAGITYNLDKSQF